MYTKKTNMQLLKDWLYFSESFLNGQSIRYNLEDDQMCGITTGGREDCFWDCEINDSFITNPECLTQCFSEVRL